MAQVTFTLPISDPLISLGGLPPASSTKFSWDAFFTIILLLCICLFGWIWLKFLRNKSSPQCTPDGSVSTGSNGSDCCSTNGIDSNGNCQPRSPMGVPQYGTTSNKIPPMPYVSTGASPLSS